ncbi:hypothetical protein SIID45300_01772 [Candidatus Magnetaquicoccaceae bacterium FCR-1]|uniref:Uncharacterized protein n=1 Tax=Candidatus Magnetaquiglobus chichijimensis TaxID=3141448 RepID=A0ABQ0C980_9PROT
MSARWIAGIVLDELRNGSGTRVELAARIPDLNPEQISNALCTLQKNEMAIVIDRRRWYITAHGASYDGQGFLSGGAGQERARKTPKKRTLRQRAWAALRRKRGGKATIPELMKSLGTDREMDANNIGCYFRRLADVGLLINPGRRVTGSGPNSPGFLLWTIPLDVGPKAPIWQTAKNQVYDPNTGETYKLPPKKQGVTP